MKLYATVASERGKEIGKGGNEYLDLTIMDADRLALFVARIVPAHDGAVLRLMTRERDNKAGWVTQEIELKGQLKVKAQ